MKTKIEPAMKTVAFVFAALLLASCGKAIRGESLEERSDKAYQTAVADYTAGRIDAAIEGFEAAIRSNPANASARFQLAVLLQEARKDYLGAMCWYRAYLLLAPSSDKARLAKERLRECEKLFAAELGKSYNLGDSAELMREIEKLKSGGASEREGRKRAECALEAASAKAASLERENARLKSMLKRMGEDEDDTAPSAPRPAPAAAKAAVDPGEESAPPPRKPVAQAEPEAEKEPTVNPEALALFEEEERTASARPAALPVPPREAADAGAAPFPAKKPAEGSRLTDLARSFREPSGDAEARPRTHIVEEGETLSMIALKYYGRKGAWRRIQDANKTAVSPDGKVKTGQVLSIP